MKRYKVTNIDGIEKVFLTDNALLKYARKVYHENEDGQPYPSTIYWLPEDVYQAKEYLNEYCDNLTLEEL